MIRNNKNTPTNFSVELMNGIYENNILNNDNLRLWDILVENKKFAGDTLSSKESHIKLKFINNTKLKVDLIKSDKTVKTIELKGKMIKQYFSIKRKILFIPIPGLFLHAERKTIIGNNEKGNLVLSRGYKNSAWILVMTSNFDKTDNFEIKRLKN